MNICIYVNVKVNYVTTLRIFIYKGMSTAYLFRAIRERDEMKGILFDMVLDGEPVLESAASTLESSGFRNNCTPYICTFVHVGSINASKPVASSSPASVLWTNTEPCCITDDDDPGVKRAKMPCGCVIGPEALKEYCEGKVEKGWFSFPCAKCDKIWPNKAVSEALSAAIPEAEFQSFSGKLNHNYFSGSVAVKTCPCCGAYVRRDPSKQLLNVSLVECPVCTKKKGSRVAFCWNCGKACVGDKTSSCGNSGCDGKDPRIKILQECGTANILFLAGTDVPKCRACVDCGRILEHDKGCKHMTCRCGCEFCFVCLKKKVKVGVLMEWQCGTYQTICSVAPRQEVIFDLQPMTKP